jgi:ribonuclease VapC
VIAVDTSALVALIFSELEAPAFLKRLARERRIVIGAPTALETRMVVFGRTGTTDLIEVDRILGRPEVEVVAWSANHAALAFDAFRRFGKGNHRASLNYGDCMSYAVARLADAPLLYKGDDFAHTDVINALA